MGGAIGESYIVDEFLVEVKGNLSPSHIKLMLQMQYWNHWTLFSNTIRATSDILDRLTDALRDAQTDIITSAESTTNVTLEQLKNMMEVVNDAKAAMARGENCSTWFVGRFMVPLLSDRFHNFYGQRGARLGRLQSIYGRPPGSQLQCMSYFFKILSPILFFAPDVHLDAIKHLRGDWVTNLPYWPKFLNKLNEEWMGHITYASILLNANVAFLAIPSNDPTTGLGGSPAQIASYLSIITSVASMMLGLLLSRRHQTRERSTDEILYLTLGKIRRRTGLEAISIMYSLPYALLMWGMITFLVAFSIMCFQNTNKLACYIVGVAWFLNAVLVAWCVYMSWEETENSWWSLYKGKLVEGAQTLIPLRTRVWDNHESESDDDNSSTVGRTRPATKIKSFLRHWFGRIKPQSSPNTV